MWPASVSCIFTRQIISGLFESLSGFLRTNTMKGRQWNNRLLQNLSRNLWSHFAVLFSLPGILFCKLTTCILMNFQRWMQMMAYQSKQITLRWYVLKCESEELECQNWSENYVISVNVRWILVKPWLIRGLYCMQRPSCRLTRRVASYKLKKLSGPCMPAVSKLSKSE